MAKRYDAVVIGGGHNGLVNAAYLAKAGLKVLVLERRHILGGATLTEEIVPGFKFSVFSYVVSLLRPEIIRDLQAAQARARDPAARRHDHAARRRLPLARERPRQDRARAASLEPERRRGLRGVRPAHGRDGPVHQADPVDRAARHGQDHARALAAARSAREGVQGPAEEDADHVHPADDDERGRLPRPVVRDRAAEGHDERLGHHRHVPGAALARHRLRAAAPLHGRDRRRVPRVGRAAGRHRLGGLRDREQRAVARRRDPHRGAASPTSRPRAGARPASCSRAARRSRPAS